MSKIQQELAKASEVDPKRGESITDEGYIKRLIVGNVAAILGSEVSP